jgi:hypothetical protein
MLAFTAIKASQRFRGFWTLKKEEEKRRKKRKWELGKKKNLKLDEKNNL